MAAPGDTSSSVKDLIAKKDAIEAEIKELMSVLESQKGVGMDGPLVDAEQFPRADIDIYTVRHARHRVSCLQNDHKALMMEIEEGLYRVHAEARKMTEVDNKMTSVQSASSSTLTPFLTVDRVDSDSPSMSAGLKVGDQVLQFGSITKDNFENLQTIGRLVQHSENQTLALTLLREGKQIRLSLTPKKWSGRGLLGCNIVPIK